MPFSMPLVDFVSFPYLTSLSVVFALASLLIWLLLLNDRITPEKIAAQRWRQFAILAVGAFFFLEASLGLLGVRGAICFVFWAIGAFVLLGGIQAVLEPVKAFFPTE